jgi:hypothetical protein
VVGTRLIMRVVPPFASGVGEVPNAGLLAFLSGFR